MAARTPVPESLMPLLVALPRPLLEGLAREWDVPVDGAVGLAARVYQAMTQPTTLKQMITKLTNLERQVLAGVVALPDSTGEIGNLVSRILASTESVLSALDTLAARGLICVPGRRLSYSSRSFAGLAGRAEVLNARVAVPTDVARALRRVDPGSTPSS